MEMIKLSLSTIKKALKNAVNHYSDHNKDYVYYEDGKGYSCYAINKYDNRHIYNLTDQALADLHGELYTTNLVAVKTLNKDTLILLIVDRDFKDTEYKYYLYSREQMVSIQTCDDKFVTEYVTTIINMEEE